MTSLIMYDIIQLYYVIFGNELFNYHRNGVGWLNFELRQKKCLCGPVKTSIVARWIKLP